MSDEPQVHDSQILPRISSYSILCASKERTETTRNGLFQHLLGYRVYVMQYQAESRPYFNIHTQLAGVRTNIELSLDKTKYTCIVSSYSVGR